MAMAPRHPAKPDASERSGKVSPLDDPGILENVCGYVTGVLNTFKGGFKQHQLDEATWNLGHILLT